MNLKKIVSLLMCLVIAISCVCFTYAASSSIVKVTISVGQGETKDLSTYMKSSSGTVTWSNGSSSIATINGTTLKGVKVGTTKYVGTGTNVRYEFTIKVLSNFSTPGVISTDKDADKVKNSNGDTINYKDRYITMGVNDTVDVSNMLNSNLKYFNYSWSTSNEKYATYKQGKITAKSEGVVRITASSRSSKEKNTIYRFYITVDSSYLSKNITVSKNTLTPLSTYVGDNAGSYVTSVASTTGSAVSIKDGYISAGNSTGTSILTAESTTGGTNYCFVVKIR